MFCVSYVSLISHFGTYTIVLSPSWYEKQNTSLCLLTRSDPTKKVSYELRNSHEFRAKKNTHTIVYIDM